MDKVSTIKAVQSAAPFVEMFKGSVFVIKIGGAALNDDETCLSIARQIKVLHTLGMRPVIVHGGGDQVSELSTELGLKPDKVDGRRITDAATLRAVVMTLNGTVNTTLLAACRKTGLEAVGISGVSSTVYARRRPPVEMPSDNGHRVVDFGHVGDILNVDTSTIETLIAAGTMPVVSPLSADDEGNLLNINADTVASAIAEAIPARKLIFMSNEPGLMSSLGDPTSLVSLIDTDELEEAVAAGSISGGMLPKIASAIQAIQAGVDRVHFISHAIEESLLLEVLTSEGCGTMIVASQSEAKPEGVAI